MKKYRLITIVVMVANHTVHSLPLGELSVTLFTNFDQHGSDCANDVTSKNPCVALMFTDSSTGAIFEDSFAHDQLVSISPVFHLTDEISEIFAQSPEISKISASVNLLAQFKYETARGRIYTIDLPLKPREYPADKKDLFELRAENSVLRRKVANLEFRLGKLEEEFSAVSNLCKILAEVSIPHVVINWHLYPGSYLDMLISNSQRNTSHLSSESGKFACNTGCKDYEKLVAAGMRVDSESAISAIKHMFSYGSGYPLLDPNFPPKFDDSHVARIKFMIESGLDLTKMVNGKCNIAEFVKFIVDENDSTIKRFSTDPSHKSKIEELGILKNLEKMKEASHIMQEKLLQMRTK